jgi:hypothetical protein
MSEQRYVIITLEDAKRIANHLSLGAHRLRSIQARLAADTGADMEEIVQRLTKLSLCCPCVIESMERDCKVHLAQKQGRRLRRLLERARGERPPGPGKDDEP